MLPLFDLPNGMLKGVGQSIAPCQGAALTLAQLRSPGPYIGNLPLRWYGFLIALALLLWVSLSMRLAKRRGISPDWIIDLSMVLVLAAIPAARLYYVAFQWDYYAQNPWEILAVWQGGIAIHGAILGGIGATLLFARWKQISFWGLADVVAPSLILGQAIGRWGNFFNSEAFGRPTDLPWKLYIPPAQRPPNLMQFDYFHPTFLYESLWNVGVFLLLMAVFLRQPKGFLPKRGTLFLLYGVGYSLGRIWIEALRMDSLMWAGVRVAQWVSLGGIVLGFAGLIWLYGWKRSLPDVVRSEDSPRSTP